jgi:IclR family pca regulon transcriptional regulator
MTDPHTDGWSIPSLREARYSQSLERGLAILAAFRPGRSVLGIADISDALGMSRSTTHRYVITLVELGYLEQGSNRKYRLGLGVTNLGAAALNAMPMHEHAAPHLEELAKQIGYTASLGVLDGDEIVLVERFVGRRGRRLAEGGISRGSRLPAANTAIGKLLLAEEEILDLRKVKIASGPNAIRTKKALRDELDEIPDAGFAVSDQELLKDQFSIAVPVRDENGETAAGLAITAHASQISLGDMVDALLPHAITIAGRVSARLGYRRQDELSAV